MLAAVTLVSDCVIISNRSRASCFVQVVWVCEANSDEVEDGRAGYEAYHWGVEVGHL